MKIWNNFVPVIKKFYCSYIKNQVDLYLFFFLTINSLFNIFQTYLPTLIAFFPNGLIFIMRCIILVIPIIRAIKKINVLSIIILGSLCIAILISSFSPQNLKMIIQIFISGESISMYILFIYIAMQKRYEVIFKTLYYASYIILFSSFICLAGGFYGSWSKFRYMEFSHSTIIYWTIITLYAFKSKDKKAVISAILFGGLIALLGNRAILLNIGACVFIYSNMYFGKRIKKLFNFAIIGSGLIGVVFFKPLTALLANFLAIFKVNSYSLISLSLGDFFSSSTRLDIWQGCISLITNHPILGNGIGADRVIYNSVGSYAHNIFLEIWVNFGIILGSFIIFIFFYFFYMLLKKGSMSVKELFIPYALTSMVILMLSKSIYILPEFWVTLALMCSYYSDDFITYVHVLIKKLGWR